MYYHIKLNKEDISKFLTDMMQFDFDIDIGTIDSHIVMDAKSLIGVMNLDFSKTLIVTPYTDSDFDLQQFTKVIDKYSIRSLILDEFSNKGEIKCYLF